MNEFEFYKKNKEIVYDIFDFHRHNCEPLPKFNDNPLPDGITKRDIRNMYLDYICKTRVILSIYPDFDVTYKTMSVYKTDQLFIEKIREDKNWMTLYNKLCIIK